MRLKLPWELLCGIILVLIWIVFHGKWGNVNYDSATFWVFMGFIGIWFARTEYIELKHWTPKIITNAFFSTTDPSPPIKIGNYGCKEVGSICSKKFGLILPADEGTLIAPIESFNKIGEGGYACTAYVVKVDKMLLPPEVYQSLLSYGFDEPFWLGFEPYTLTEPDVVRLRAELEERNKNVNMLREILKEKLGIIEDTVASHERVTSKLKPDRMTNFKRAIQPEEMQ